MAATLFQSRLVPSRSSSSLLLNVRNYPLIHSLFHCSLPCALIHRSKQHVHLLECPALRLLRAEEDEHANRHAKHAEHDERPPSDVVDRVGRELRDDKVEQPLGGCSETDAVCAQTSREDLAIVRRCAIHRETTKGREGA